MHDDRDVADRAAVFATARALNAAISVAKSVQLNLKDTGLNWHITNKNGYYSPFSYSAS